MSFAKPSACANDDKTGNERRDPMTWAELSERLSQCRDCAVADRGRPLLMRGDPTGARVLYRIPDERG